jgi:uncharacterized protein (TIGR02118 family)
MMKSIWALPRRKGISAEKFHDHWRHPHGTIAKKNLGLSGYVQNHQVNTSLLDSDQNKFEGVVEAWLEEQDGVDKIIENDIYQKFMGPDLQNFIDLDRLVILSVRETVIIDGIADWNIGDSPDLAWNWRDTPVAAKILQFIDPKCRGEWAPEEDIEIVKRIGGLRLVHNLAEPPEDGHALSYSGVREIWWPTISAFEAGVANSSEAWADLLARPGAALTLLSRAERMR